jgi:hypothetical protein
MKSFRIALFSEPSTLKLHHLTSGHSTLFLLPGSNESGYEDSSYPILADLSKSQIPNLTTVDD